MKKPKVFIMTAVSNSIGDTKKLFKCLCVQSYKNHEIYLVDDGSVDGTYDYVSKNYPQTKIIKGDGSLWWTGSIFAGVRKILKVAKNEDYIVTINNDCEFSRGYIASLVAAAEESPNSIIGSLVVDEANDRLWDTGIFIDWTRGKFFQKKALANQNIRRGVMVATGFDALSSKGTLYPIHIIKRVGNFDRVNLPHYLSDYEITVRAKRIGYKLAVSYKSKIYNRVENTGLGDKISNTFSPSYLRDLFFSRRSKVNLADRWNFIKVACPEKYKVRNYIFVLLMAIYYVFHIPPLTLLMPVAKWLRKNLF